MSTSTVLVALSGGVDSSVALAEVVEAGHRAIAVTMRTFCYGEVAESERSCCGLEGITDARAVADALGVQHQVVDLAPVFERRVIDDFVAEYKAGRTPNPCVRCNTHVKFPALLDRFRALGVDAIATGHHARVVHDAEGSWLERGADAAKDQSYVLWGLPRELLRQVVFPIGHMTKAEVRARARELGLETAERAESQEICFVPDGRHAEFVAGRAPEAMTPGPIVGPEGQVLGRHRGIAAYTVGQRKGLGIASSEPLYVRAIDAESRAVHVAFQSGLFVGRCWIDQINRFGDFSRGERVNGLKLQVRAHQEPWDAALTLLGGGQARVELGMPAAGVAPGQSAVLYQGERVLLGGVIARTAPADCPEAAAEENP